MKLNFINLGLTYNSIPKVRGYTYNKILLKSWIEGTPTVMVKRKALECSRLFDENLPAREEYDLWIRISKEWK